MADMITSTCPVCGVTFQQPNDPGRKRIFDKPACRQKSYRQHGGRASGTRYQSPRAEQRRAQEESWAREEARREQERQRSSQRRGRGERIVTPPWCQPRTSDSTALAKKRRVCQLLMARANHASTPAAEAEQCREKAASMRSRHGL